MNSIYWTTTVCDCISAILLRKIMQIVIKMYKRQVHPHTVVWAEK